jgi:hypothetical protein
MKKLLSLILIIPFFISAAFSQEKEYEKLHLMYVDGKYEKLFYQSVKLTEKESTRKEPLPYLYTSMALFHISENPDRNMEEFKNAFKEAVKYAAKFRKVDKENEYLKFEPEYFKKLKKVLNVETKNYFVDLNNESTLRKGSSYIKNYFKIDGNNTGLQYLLSVIYEASNNRSNIPKTIEKINEIEEVYQFEIYTDEDINILIYGLTTYAKFQKDNGDISEGKRVLDYYVQYLNQHEEFSTFYDKF